MNSFLYCRPSPSLRGGAYYFNLFCSIHFMRIPLDFFSCLSIHLAWLILINSSKAINSQGLFLDVDLTYPKL